MQKSILFPTSDESKTELLNFFNLDVQGAHNWCLSYQAEISADALVCHFGWSFITGFSQTFLKYVQEAKVKSHSGQPEVNSIKFLQL